VAQEEIVAGRGEEGYRNTRRPGRMSRFAYNPGDLEFCWSPVMIAHTRLACSGFVPSGGR
jgi:hypothetical protein